MLELLVKHCFVITCKGGQWADGTGHGIGMARIYTIRYGTSTPR